jgi:CrcB protein
MILLVAGAAAVGAAARYLLDRLIQHGHELGFPVGTLAINVLGSFGLGLTTGLSSHHGLATTPTTVIGVGLCGGFTTWSTFCWETVALVESNAGWQAALNVVGSLAAGLLAAAAGLAIALA